MKSEAIKSNRELSVIAQSICDAVTATPIIIPDRLMYIVQEDEQRGAVYVGICYKPPIQSNDR